MASEKVYRVNAEQFDTDVLGNGSVPTKFIVVSGKCSGGVPSIRPNGFDHMVNPWKS